MDPTPVVLTDPGSLTEHERCALLAHLHADGVVVYRTVVDPGPAGILRLGAQLGFVHTDHHPGADASGVVRLEVRDDMARYIPYTRRRLRWHTDGYYRADDRRIRSFLLHCVRAAARGGENLLLDPRRLYIALRDENPDWIRALCSPHAFSIPEAQDEEGEIRPAFTGPVFDADRGHLHMRFTERSRNIEWSPGCATARERLGELLETLPARQLLLRPGEGLLAHNVLHCRRAFEDEPSAPRLLYRSRYTDYAAPPC